VRWMPQCARTRKRRLQCPTIKAAIELDANNSSKPSVSFAMGGSFPVLLQLPWAAGKPGTEDQLLSSQSDTEAYYGQALVGWHHQSLLVRGSRHCYGINYWSMVARCSFPIRALPRGPECTFYLE